MSLDSVFLSKFQSNDWFKANGAAWTIVKDGLQEISSTKPANYNLQCLLSNMCAYGALKWTYEPGSVVNVPNTLKGTHRVTDCKSLAEIFCEIAKRLGYETATPRKIEKRGCRIVTKPGMVTFKGKSGDRSLEGRWCFGDHWVAEYLGQCYDPTFKFMGFAFAAADTVYLGWYAKEERDETVFTKTYWKKDQTVNGSKDVYIRQFPDVGYTFKRTDVKTGREIG
jgi:hypothetical protein